MITHLGYICWKITVFVHAVSVVCLVTLVVPLVMPRDFQRHTGACSKHFLLLTEKQIIYLLSLRFYFKEFGLSTSRQLPLAEFLACLTVSVSRNNKPKQ